MTPFANTLYCQCYWFHVVWQQVVSDASAVRSCWNNCSLCFECNNYNLLLRLLTNVLLKRLFCFKYQASLALQDGGVYLVTLLHLIYRPIFKIGKSTTLSVTLTACVVAGESKSVIGCRVVGSRGWGDTTVRGIASPVAWTGSERVGKDKGYNHVCAADAPPNQNCATLSLVIWPIPAIHFTRSQKCTILTGFSTSLAFVLPRFELLQFV